MRRFAPIAILAVGCGVVFAQQPDSTTAFEAASLKPWPESTMLSWSGCQGGPGSSDPGQVECRYATVRMFMTRAYGVRSQEVFGPDWIDTERFNLLAKLPPGAGKEQLKLMYQNFLAERFKLVVHHETRPLPAYILTVAKSGLKIKEGVQLAPDEAPRSGNAGPKIGDDGFPILRPSQYQGGAVTLFRQGKARMLGGNVTMATFAQTLSGQMDRIVTDETGLPGKYDLVLNWTPESTELGGHAREGASQDAKEPAADMVAAIEQQLGLKLVSKKVNCNVLVIDRGEKTPTEN